MTTSLQLNLLGAPELSRGGAPLSGLRSHKAIALLVYLACNPGPQRREFLADLLWDAASTAQSLSNLRTVLSRLRGYAGDHLLITQETLAIAPAVLVDAAVLEDQLQASAGHLSPDSAARLEKVLALYRSDFLAGFHLPGASGFEQWAIVERERLRFAVLQGYRQLAEYAIQRGDYPAAVRVVAAWLAVDPLDEEAHGQMMASLAHDGQQAAALAHYAKCRQLLAAELDVEPGEELQELHRQIAAGELTAPAAPEAATPARRRHNLPQRLTSFVGRGEELSLIRSLLQTPTTRLVTVVGEGGVGKSSLAVAVGEAAVDGWADGVCYAPLAGVEAEPAATLSHRLATALALAVELIFSTARGAPEPAVQLFNFLSHRPLLLILDSFEHLNAQAAFVGALLQAAPSCQVLVTSRQPLLLEGESVVRLEGLPIPPTRAVLPVPPVAYASLALFAERARQRQHAFAISSANEPALARLCQLVAGNALALELAASWVEHFSPDEMVAQLETAMLDFLRNPLAGASERHSSLRRVMETSWRLLSPAAQRLLAQLSVFRGSFHRDAALEITGSTLEELVHLVNASLLQQPAPGRYVLHEMVRQFAGEQLTASPKLRREAAERHARYYLALVSRVERTSEMIAPVSQELANLRQAWKWAVENGDVAGLAAASTGLWNFYLRKGLFQEAEEAFGSAIDATLALPLDTTGRRRALAALRVAQAIFLNIRSRYTEAISVAEEAVDYGLQEENEAIIARGYLQWGTALYRQGRYEDAVARLRMALIAAQDRGLAGDEADVLRHLGVTWLEQSDFAAAQARCEEALAIYLRTGNRLGEGNTLTDLGWIKQRQQSFEEARVYLEAAEQTHSAIDNRHGATIARLNLGIVLQMTGDLSGAYDIYWQLFRELGEQPDPYHHSLVNHSLGVLLTRLGDYAPARRYLLAALEIDRSTGDRGGLAWSYNGLGLLHNHLGDPKTGLAYHREALRIGQEQGASTVEGISLLGIGQDMQALGQWQEAQTAYEQALVVQVKLQQKVRVIESRSGLARSLLELAQRDAALAQVEQILAYLATQSLRGAAQPALVYWNCYAVLRAVDDPRAPALLAQVYDLVQSQAARIHDERLRRSYLRALRPHPEIIREVEALRLSPRFGGVEQREASHKVISNQ
ncbi:MAG: tetratricopeptide repeat protein [Chloroflexi bacterium]|nr:tetratricopeptide repeat protein [Chloroflexota bacterium]